MGYGDTTKSETTTNIKASEAEAIIAFAKARCEPQVLKLEDPCGDIGEHMPVLLGSDGRASSLKGLIDEWRARPVRRKGCATATTLASFVELVNRDRGDNSVIFADDGADPSLTAVLNYHGAGGADEEASFLDDRVRYAFPLSEEWKAWTAKDGEPMGQGAFAEFLEDNLLDIGEPGSAGAITEAFCRSLGVTLAGPQKLLGLSRGLSIRVEQKVAQIVNLQTGEGRLTFEETHREEFGGALTVPAAFHIRIPVFRGGAIYSIPVRLRYRASAGKITWFYEIHRAELFLQDAVNDALVVVRRAEEHEVPGEAPGCGLPVYLGSPPV